MSQIKMVFPYVEILERVRGMQRLHTKEEQTCYLESLHQVLGDVERIMMDWWRLQGQTTYQHIVSEPMNHGEHSAITWLRNTIRDNGAPINLGVMFEKSVKHQYTKTWPQGTSIGHGPQCYCDKCFEERRACTS